MSYSLSDCRVCLKNSGSLPIFGDEFKPDISLEVQIFGCIYLAKDDGFPQYICRDCFKLLEAAILFKKYAKSSQARLKRWSRKTARDLPNISNNLTSSVNIQNEVFEQNEPVSEVTSETNYTAEFLLNSTEPRINFVSVRQDYPSVEYEVPLIDENPEDHTEAFLAKAPVYESEISVGDSEIPAVDNKIPVVDNEIPVVDTKVSVVDNEIPIEENKIIIVIEPDKSEVEEYYCKYCHLKFILEEKYEEHRTTIEHKRNYVMSFFPKKTAHPKDLKCDICDKFFTKLYYPRHMEREHGIVIEKSTNIGKKECTICNKMYNPLALVQHIKKIHGDKSDLPPKVKLECRVCKKLVSKEFYPLHIQRHTQGDTKNYVCEQCGKKFFFKSSFCTHRLTHSNDLPHKCEYCPYRGRTKELLKIHVRTHTGDYPYKCTECGTSCITKSNLNSHMKRHRGPVDFICDTCHRGFYSKIQLERHINVNHLGMKSHVCSICGAAFGYKHGLMGHQRKVHKRPKGLGKPKAVYLQLEEEALTDPSFEV